MISRAAVLGALRVVLLASLASGCAAPALTGQAGVAAGEDTRDQTHRIPLVQEDGTQVLLLGRVCQPAGDGEARVVVFAHGTPPQASTRPTMTLRPCDSEAIRWFTSRGYMVVASLRRGYGGTGGTYVESYGPCTAEGYERVARESARDVAATVEYALSLPRARRTGAVVVGQSAGGWATLGLNSQPHPGVIALVSMAGGRGGHLDNRPDNNCHSENLVAAAGELGRTSTTPMLWVYTANDSFFGPSIAREMHDAFTAAGGRAEFHALPAFGRDGHGLFFGRGGTAVWGPLMEEYLRARGVG